MELIGFYLIGCGLLVVAGAMKVVRPDDTARALAPLMPGRLGALSRFRRMRAIIRVAAGLEAALGVVAIAVPRSLTAAFVAGSYFAFAGVVAVVRSRGGALASCGCFGTPDVPATILHVVVDVVLAIAAVVLAASAPGHGTLVTALGHESLHGVPLLLVSAVGAWLTYVTLSLFSALEGVRRSHGVPADR